MNQTSPSRPAWRFFAACAVLGAALAGGIRGASADPVMEAIVAHASAHPRGEAPASFDRSLYSGDPRHLPIGVFDSGIGGLTVLEAILTLDAFHNDTLQPGPDGTPDFAEERFIYLGDQANMPYGRYPAEGRADFLRELILKDALFLLGKRWWHPGEDSPRLDKPPVKAIVIACNTATAWGLDDIRTALAAWEVPVIVVGVVEAGARGVLESRRGQAGDNSSAIAVMATEATCASDAYPKTIRSTLGRAGHGPPVITQQGSASLAAVIEGNPDYPLPLASQALADVRELLENHRDSGATAPIDTVVLGCTHYPLALAEIDRAFDLLREQEPELGRLAATRRLYIDPAEWAARELFRELALARIRLKPGEGREEEGDLFFLSAPAPGAPLSEDGSGLDRGYQYGREPGNPGLEDTRVIPLTPESLPEAGARLVREKLPETWRRLSSARAGNAE